MLQGIVVKSFFEFAEVNLEIKITLPYNFILLKAESRFVIFSKIPSKIYTCYFFKAAM